MLLTNKVALITGGGQGVGLGIAKAMAAEGAKLAVAGRTLDKLESACEQLHSMGAEAEPIQCDVKDFASLEACVQSAVKRFGGIDILVNNAQEVPLGTLMEVSESQFEAGWQSGPMATFRLMKLCHPHMKARGGGCIINLASTAAKRWDAAGFGAYAAVKESTRAISRAAASEWAMDGIRTNVILPHAKSPGLEWWIENCPEEAAEFVKTIPMRRVGECEEDIGRFVAMLCSDNSRYVNGQSIAIDGGQAYMG